MKTNRLQWLATVARYLGLGMALSSWSSRPPTSQEIQEVTSRLRELFPHARGERSAALSATCCSPTVTLCCPTVALA
jgi:hypothetical protein